MEYVTQPCSWRALFGCSCVSSGGDVANSTQPVVAVAAAAAAAKKDVKDATGPAHRDAEDTEDTMRNLRKTFAGIFGDM